MTREEAAARLADIASDLAEDVRLSQTREQHMRMARRLSQVEALRAELTAGG